MASAAHALRLGPEGFRATPAAVTLTRSVTVTLDLVDATNRGASTLGAELFAEPFGLVRLVEAHEPPLFTCTPGGRSRGRWVYEAVATGTVRFRAVVQMITCESIETTNAEFRTAGVTLRPARVDSALTIEPPQAAPGETLTYVLRLRNTGTEEVAYGVPRAEVDYGGRGEPVLEIAGGPDVEPAAALTEGRLRLAPAADVIVRWRFRAVRAGGARVQIVAAGLIIRPPAVRVRLAAKLDLALGAAAGPTAVGRVVTLRGSLGTQGDAGVRDLAVAATWSPPAAARLVSAAVSATRVELDGPRAPVTVVLEMLRPGPLMVTVTASGRETDSDRAVETAPLTRLIAVQAPPELTCVVQPASSTVLAGSKASFRLAVINRSPTATAGLAPMTLLRRGDAETLSFTPLHSGVPGGASVWFTGGLIPDAAGEIEFVAQVTGRGERGGSWLTATSEPARVRAVAVPRLEIWPLSDRAFQGVTATIRFLARNAGVDTVRITGLSLNLTMAGSGGAVPRVGPLPVVLAPGASATLSAPAYLPPAAAAYTVTGSLSFTGTLTGWGLPFSWLAGSRPLLRAGPAATAITQVEPPGAFMPVADPYLYVEWTKTIAGDAGVAVTTPDGRPVRTLRPLGPMPRGIQSVLWRGDDDAGRPVPAGGYVVRLAGPRGPVPVAAATVSATVPAEAPRVWPMDAGWTRDHAFTVGAP